MYSGLSAAAGVCVGRALAASGSAGGRGQVVVVGHLLLGVADAVFAQVNGYYAW